MYTFRRMDGHVRAVRSGTHLVVPLVERVAHKISLAGAAMPVEDLAVGGQRYRGVVYFQVLDPERADVVIEDLENLLHNAMHRWLAAPGLPEAADLRRAWLKQSLNTELRDRGLLIARVDLNALN